MMAERLLAELRRAGIDVTFDVDGLRVRAPKGVLTPELRALITEHRDGLLALVIAEHDAAAMDAVDDRLSSDGAEPEPLDPVRPAGPLCLKPPLGRHHAGNLAARFTREEIAAMLARVEARAAEPNASPIFAQLVADYTELLAAKDRMRPEVAA